MNRILSTIAVCLFASAPAAAECIAIDYVPITILEPGSYCLVKSLDVNAASGAAISIESDDVSIDLAGNTLRNSYGADTRAAGVSARDRFNVTVSGGTLVGFDQGVLLVATGDRCSRLGKWYRVDRMNIQDSRTYGIRMSGCNLVAHSNWVARVGTFGEGNPKGISMDGTQISIVDNDVQGVLGNWYVSYGIHVGSGTGVVEGNRILAVPNGVYAQPQGNVAYRGNTAMEIGRSRYLGGQDAGGNF